MIFITELFFGDTGSLVSLLQLALRRCGFLGGAVDGVFGVLTRDAVTRFQQSYSLPVTGNAQAATLRSLEPFLRGYFNYAVREGDTLWRIANRYGTTLSAVKTANPGINENSLSIGQVITVPYGFDIVPTDIPYSYELVSFITEGLAARYPFLVSGSIGESVMGKSIRRLSLGFGEKEVFYSAAIHANEWITVPLVLKYLEDACFAYANGKTVSGTDAISLFDRITLHTVPLINPDGVDLVTGALRSGEYYNSAERIAEKYPAIPFPSGWKANIEGTDLNLQFPAEWKKAKEIKFAQGFTSPAPRDYVGSAPLSAPESRALYDYTLENNFSLILAFHTQGKIIYPNFGNYNPPFSKIIGETLSRVSGYSLENTPSESANAGYKDWFIQQYNRPGYTVECGRGSNPLPLSQFDTIYSDCKPLMTAAMTEILRLT